jgi:Mg2+ and Co2+ transporter CorA
MLKTLLRDESNQFSVVEDPTAISEIVLGQDRLLWLDLERPTRDEFALIQEEFSLHPLAIEDAMSRHQRPKVDQYDTFYLVIFYTVAVQEPGEKLIPGRRGLSGSSFLRYDAAKNGIDKADQTEGAQDQGVVSAPVVEREGEHLAGIGEERIVLNELTLFMGHNFLITVHDNPIPELDEAARRWTQNVTAISAGMAPAGRVPGTRRLQPGESAVLNSHIGRPTGPEQLGDGHGASADRKSEEESRPVRRETGEEKRKDDGHPRDVGILLYSLLDTIVDDYFPVIDSLVERIELVEEQIFERFDQKALASIFALKKDLLALRRVLAPERDVLNVLTRRDLVIFDASTTLYFQDVYDHVVRVTDSIDIYRDLLSSALDGYLSMQSNRLNITVQTLTSVSIMLMSVAAITGWYGMNFEMMPELRHFLGYPGVMIAVAVVVITEFVFFKRKGWL